MTQTKSFSVFSNLKSEDHLKGKRKQQKTALHSLLRTVVGGIIESIAATTTAILSFCFIFQTNSKSRNINYIF